MLSLRLSIDCSSGKLLVSSSCSTAASPACTVLDTRPSAAADGVCTVSLAKMWEVLMARCLLLLDAGDQALTWGERQCSLVLVEYAGVKCRDQRVDMSAGPVSVFFRNSSNWCDLRFSSSICDASLWERSNTSLKSVWCPHSTCRLSCSVHRSSFTCSRSSSALSSIKQLLLKEVLASSSDITSSSLSLNAETSVRSRTSHYAYVYVRWNTTSEYACIYDMEVFIFLFYDSILSVCLNIHLCNNYDCWWCYNTQPNLVSLSASKSDKLNLRGVRWERTVHPALLANYEGEKTD